MIKLKKYKLNLQLMAVITIFIMMVTSFFSFRFVKLSSSYNFFSLKIVKQLDNLSFVTEKDIDTLKAKTIQCIYFLDQQQWVWKIFFLVAGFQAVIVYILIMTIYFKKKYIKKKNSFFFNFVTIISIISIFLFAVIGCSKLKNYNNWKNKKKEMIQKFKILNCESKIKCYKIKEYVKNQYVHKLKEILQLMFLLFLSVSILFLLESLCLISIANNLENKRE